MEQYTEQPIMKYKVKDVVLGNRLGNNTGHKSQLHGKVDITWDMVWEQSNTISHRAYTIIDIVHGGQPMGNIASGNEEN